MQNDGHWRRLLQFRLVTLLLQVTVVGPCFYLTYSYSGPYVVLQRIDCGRGRYLEVLRPNEFFCDRAEPVYYRVSGIAHGDSPPGFAYWSCGWRPTIGVMTADGDEIAAAYDEESSDELLILVDFKKGRTWPATNARKVDEYAREMLKRLRLEHGDSWLQTTYDHELTKPRL